MGHSCEEIYEEVLREKEGNPRDCDDIARREGPASFKENREVE